MEAEEQAYSSDEAEGTALAHATRRRARTKARAIRPDTWSHQRAAPDPASVAADVAAVVQSVLGFAVSPDQVPSRLSHPTIVFAGVP